MGEQQQLVMTGMFDARIQSMVKELKAMPPRVLCRRGLLDLHEQTRRLLELPNDDTEEAG